MVLVSVELCADRILETSKLLRFTSGLNCEGQEPSLNRIVKIASWPYLVSVLC